MRRVVVDPGVLVSAIITPASPPAAIIRAAREGRLELLVSPHLLAELSAVLAREKFRGYVNIAEAREYVEGLSVLAQTVEDTRVTEAQARDPSDDYLIALARAAGVAALVSGDADLLALHGPQLPVLTPRALLRMLESERS